MGHTYMAHNTFNIDNIPNMRYYYHPNSLSNRDMSVGWQLTFQEVKQALGVCWSWQWYKMTGVLVMSETGNQQNIIAHLRSAQAALDGALVTAREGNALVMEVPVFQQLEKMKKDLTAAMQAVGKMRGLG